MNRLYDATATELLKLLSERRCSVKEIVASCIERIEALEPSVRAFVDVDPTGALRQADECDRKGISGRPLHGMPVAIKDTVDVAGLHCTWGTPIHADRVPGRDAALVTRLKAAGAIVMGTTVTTEYAIARAGPTRNPHNLAHTPGGSSSGSGAAVAARMVPLAIATQSVGSIIRPSSFCGVFGLKPTKGAISGLGCMLLSPPLDHAGPMARSVEDIALISGVLYGRESGDPYGESVPPPRNAAPPAGLKVIRIDGPLQERIEPPTAEALTRAHSAFEAAGYRVTPVELPARFRGLIECYETIIFRDMAINHGRDRDLHGDRMSERFRGVIDKGRTIGDAQYSAALGEAAYYRAELLKLLDDSTVILTPATDGSAPVYSESSGEQKLQSLWTVTGLPSLCTPCGKVSGLPVAVQIVAQPANESLALAAARVIEARYAKESLLA